MAGDPGAAAARELTAKGRATRARVVSAAAELMYEQGVASTSLQDVQQAARVGGSQMYHYFPDKASLVRAVVETQGEVVLARQQPWLDKLNSLEGIRVWRDFVVSTQRRRECRGGCQIGTLAAELADTDADARGELAGIFARWSAAIRRGLQDMQDRGRLAPEADTAQLADALLAAAEGGLLISKTTRSVTVLEHALDTVIAYIASLAR